MKSVLFFLILCISNPTTYLFGQDIEGYDLVFDDDFNNNVNRWQLTNEKASVIFEGGKMIVTNEYKKPKKRFHDGCFISVPIKNDDDYIIETSFSDLYNCYSGEAYPYERRFNFTIGTVGESATQLSFWFYDDTESTSHYERDRATRQKILKYFYKCIPTYAIYSCLAGNCYFPASDKTSLIKDNAGLNALKIVKESNKVKFYLNGVLLSSIDAISLGEENKIFIRTKKGNKIMLDYLKVYKKRDE